MSQSRVSVVRCQSYEPHDVLVAVERGIGLLGGLIHVARASERILLKPNVMAGDPPERAATTHPAVFSAVAEVLRSATSHLSYGDSPGIGTSERQLQKAGYQEAARKLDVVPADFESGVELELKDSPSLRRFVVAKGLMETDGLVNLSKLKTHQLTRITGAVKNQFGCIPGRLKGEMHRRFPDVHAFSRMLVALNLLLKPRLYIMDGIVAMEGNGPRSGSPVSMNVLLFSQDPIALDAVVCRLVGLAPELVPTIKAGYDWGLGRFHTEDVLLLGDPIDSLRKTAFDVSREAPRDVARSASHTPARSRTLPRPIVDSLACVRCGICVQVCPAQPKAMKWSSRTKLRTPICDYRKCIRCYCCQEMCPEGAISVQTLPLSRHRQP
jgi:uncharacterized protein (DUF362 family)/NAD-dependent dihydropyrimidine dehydrogenase PreA subunit